MQLVKIVFTLLAVGGPNYALFQFPHAPAFVVYEGSLFAISLVLPSGVSDYAPAKRRA